MRKVNRRSQLNKRDRHSQVAQKLLDSFYWEWDQRVLLELAATGFFTVDEIREFRWNQLRLGFNCLIVKEKEIEELPEEVFTFLEDCINEKKDISGQPLEAPEDKLFTHKTGKDIYKEIISYKD